MKQEKEKRMSVVIALNTGEEDGVQRQVKGCPWVRVQFIPCVTGGMRVYRGMDVGRLVDVFRSV